MLHARIVSEVHDLDLSGRLTPHHLHIGKRAGLSGTYFCLFLEEIHEVPVLIHGGIDIGFVDGDGHLYILVLYGRSHALINDRTCYCQCVVPPCPDGRHRYTRMCFCLRQAKCSISAG